LEGWKVGRLEGFKVGKLLSGVDWMLSGVDWMLSGVDWMLSGVEAYSFAFYLIAKRKEFLLHAFCGQGSRECLAIEKA